MSSNPPRRSLLGSFSRSQVASAAATLIDFVLLFFLAEVCHVWYVAATAAGALAGAVTNFVMNRQWSFLATDQHWSNQAKRYALVSGGSLLLNSGGVYLMTESLHVHYSVSVVVISFMVGWAFNFPMQRHYVFR
ncbi:MAG: GtrA family protein [Bdellovibrionia bacterium]